MGDFCQFCDTILGRVTIQLLQLNHPDRIEEHKLLIMAGRLGLQD